LPRNSQHRGARSYAGYASGWDYTLWTWSG